MKQTDRIADKVSEWMGSIPYFVGFSLFCAAWVLLGIDSDLLTLLLSILAIHMTIVIERSTTKLNETLKELIKQSKDASEEDLKITRRIERKVDKL